MPTVRASAAWAMGVKVAENAKAPVSNTLRRIKRRDSIKDLAFLVWDGKTGSTKQSSKRRAKSSSH
jgi:hypothetical protein